MKTYSDSVDANVKQLVKIFENQMAAADEPTTPTAEDTFTAFVEAMAIFSGALMATIYADFDKTSPGYVQSMFEGYKSMQKTMSEVEGVESGH